MEQDLSSYLEAEPLESSTVSYTGIGALWLSLMDYITESQIRGFLLAFTAIAAMMCLLFRSLRIGLLSMLPNLAPVTVGLGIMGWIDLPLDYQRLLMAPVAIGISVDFTIHLVTRYRHEFFEQGDYESALRASMEDVGRALLFTALVLVTGFLVFTASIMDAMASFGLLLAAAIVVALLANFFLMPALVMTFEPFGTTRVAPDRDGAGDRRRPT
jgi:predicted RND superfamily exporter protein